MTELSDRQPEPAEKGRKSERWTSPLTVAVAAAAIAGFSNLWLAYANNRAALTLERNRAESERILEMLKAGDPARVRENLRFLLQLGLVQDEELRRRIEGWQADPNRAPFYLQRDRLGALREAAQARRGASQAPPEASAAPAPPGGY